MLGCIAASSGTVSRIGVAVACSYDQRTRGLDPHQPRDLDGSDPAVQPLLAGVDVGLPQSRCGKRTAGAGAVIEFLGIACPVCNKVLVLLVGSALLLEYYEPVRLHVALAGVVLLAAGVGLKLSRPDYFTMPRRAADVSL